MSIDVGELNATENKSAKQVRCRFIALAAAVYKRPEREWCELATKSNVPLKAIQTFT